MRETPADRHAEGVQVISDLETLKVVSDPLRLQLLALLRQRSHTVKELAAALDLPQTRLYYHVNQLESHGLVRVAETRVVAGIIEKRYRASANRLSIARSLLSPAGQPGDPALEAMLSAILDETRDAVRASVGAGLVDPGIEPPREGGLVLGRRWLCLTLEQAGDLYDRIKALLDEFDAAPSSETDPNARRYELLLGLYPMVPEDDDD